VSERIYILLTGACLLAALYLEQSVLIYGLIGLLLFEGITDMRLTIFLQKARHVVLDIGLATFPTTQRFELEAIRVWRLFVAIVLLVTYVLSFEFNYDVLWFFPWFMGFALLGAGVSSICPVLLAIRWLGFK